jgi:hypothetical protein
VAGLIEKRLQDNDAMLLLAKGERSKCLSQAQFH